MINFSDEADGTPAESFVPPRNVTAAKSGCESSLSFTIDPERSTELGERKRTPVPSPVATARSSAAPFANGRNE